MKMTLRRLTHSRIALILALISLCSACTSAEARAQNRAALESEIKTAIVQIKQIVNQPVAKLVRREDMQVATYQPGWFHEGASRPDFNNVDVRKTQQTPYAQHKYVTSNINPGFAFLGAEVEFNSMIKYFYDDYTLPKKKLSDAEMEEVNRLYRVIGRCEKELAKL